MCVCEREMTHDKASMTDIKPLLVLRWLDVELNSQVIRIIFHDTKCSDGVIDHLGAPLLLIGVLAALVAAAGQAQDTQTHQTHTATGAVIPVIPRLKNLRSVHPQLLLQGLGNCFGDLSNGTRTLSQISDANDEHTCT